MAGLGAFLVSVAGPIARKVLASIGVGVVSYAAISTALNGALSAAKTALSGLGGDGLAIIQMTGIFTAFSIIAGALIARVGLNAIKKFEVLK